jgi:Flp pilus assembly protein TadG
MNRRLRTLAARLRRSRCDDTGSVTPFVVIIAVVLLAVAGLVLDYGNALAEKDQALDVAQSAARAGAQEIDLAALREGRPARIDPQRAIAAARAWLRQARVTGTVTATPGGVTVTVAATSRTQLLQIIGVRQLHTTASATAIAVQGVNGAGT